MPFLDPFREQIYALLRIMSGLMFMLHGTMKLFGWPGEDPPAELASLAGAAGVIEFITGLLITIGLFAGIAAFIASGTMAVAYFIGHASGGFFPVVNKGELAVLYCFLFLYIASKGSGIWSVDQFFRSRSVHH